MTIDPTDLVTRRAYVRVYSGALGHEDQVMAEGRACWYHDGPMLGVEDATGQHAWPTRLRIVEISPPEVDEAGPIETRVTDLQATGEVHLGRAYDDALEAWHRDMQAALRRLGDAFVALAPSLKPHLATTPRAQGGPLSATLVWGKEVDSV